MKSKQKYSSMMIIEIETIIKHRDDYRATKSKRLTVCEFDGRSWLLISGTATWNNRRTSGIRPPSSISCCRHRCSMCFRLSLSAAAIAVTSWRRINLSAMSRHGWRLVAIMAIGRYCTEKHTRRNHHWLSLISNDDVWKENQSKKICGSKTSRTGIV